MNAVTPALRAKTNPHIFLTQDEDAGGPGLRATRCRACNRFTLGRVRICSHCFSREVEMKAAGQRGELVEFSIARHPAGGFEAPYAIGMIRTEEGLTLFSPLQGDIDSLAPGARLHFTLIDRENGQIGFAYMAEPEHGP